MELRAGSPTVGFIDGQAVRTMCEGTAGLRVHASPSACGPTRVEVTGEIDVATVRQLREALDRAAEGAERVELDLAAVDFMSCSGMRCLVDVRPALPGLRIVAASAPVRRLLSVYGVDELLEPVPYGELPRGSAGPG